MNRFNVLFVDDEITRFTKKRDYIKARMKEVQLDDHEPAAKLLKKELVSIDSKIAILNIMKPLVIEDLSIDDETCGHIIQGMFQKTNDDKKDSMQFSTLQERILRLQIKMVEVYSESDETKAHKIAGKLKNLLVNRNRVYNELVGRNQRDWIQG